MTRVDTGTFKNDAVTAVHSVIRNSRSMTVVRTTDDGGKTVVARFPYRAYMAVPRRTAIGCALHDAKNWIAEHVAGKVQDLKPRLTRAFASLRKCGFFARQDFMCCMSCGCAAIPKGTRQFVFYHNQECEHMLVEGVCYLVWGGTVSDGKTICRALADEGALVHWDGSLKTRIMVGSGAVRMAKPSISLIDKVKRARGRC